MEKVIKKEFSGWLEKSLLNIVRSVQNRPAFIADCFENSMKGLGTNDEKLIRLVVRYRDPRLREPIKAAYLQKYGKSLRHRIEGETSGDYR